MSSSSFASLHAGMLVRKGAAAPSLENPPAARPWALAVPPAEPIAQPTARAPRAPEPRPAPVAPTPIQPKPAPADTQPQRAETEACIPAPAASPSDTAKAPMRAGVRLTHEQGRALKLAALLLDRPQQELLAAGLDLRIEALACGPLSHCACFRAVAEQLKDL